MQFVYEYMINYFFVWIFHYYLHSLLDWEKIWSHCYDEKPQIFVILRISSRLIAYKASLISLSFTKKLSGIRLLACYLFFHLCCLCLFRNGRKELTSNFLSVLFQIRSADWVDSPDWPRLLIKGIIWHTRRQDVQKRSSIKEDRCKRFWKICTNATGTNWQPWQICRFTVSLIKKKWK